MDGFAPFGLYQAVSESDDLRRLKQLIEAGFSVDSPYQIYRTPLHMAAAEGQCEVAELLIRSKCDLNIKNRAGDTPAMVAAKRGKISIVDLLLQRGAQVSCADRDGLTLLHCVSRNGWTDLVRRILEREEADLNAASMHGDTPLAWARIMRHEEVVLQAGSDVHHKDARKRTALHNAACHGRTAGVVRLPPKEKGLDLNSQNEAGDTPLHQACFWGRREDIKQLLVAGADTTLKNNEGETALTRGIRRQKLTLEEIKLFVQQGAFLQGYDYVRISENPFLKESVLRDVYLCTQSIVNKFHHQSLPALKSISYFARKLPNINKFELKARQIDEVENLVKCEIERNAFCNVAKAHPMALSALCVLSLITCQSGMKRPASPDFGDSHSPLKKIPP